MPYISSFVYCDNVPLIMTPQGPQPQIMNPLDALRPISIPGNFTFCICCNVSDLELGKEHLLQIAFFDPDGKLLCEFVNAKFAAPEHMQDGQKPQALQMNVDVRNVVLRKTGIHRTEVRIDGEVIGEYKINVIEGENHA